MICKNLSCNLNAIIIFHVSPAARTLTREHLRRRTRHFSCPRWCKGSVICRERVRAVLHYLARAVSASVRAINLDARRRAKMHMHWRYASLQLTPRSHQPTHPPYVMCATPRKVESCTKGSRSLRLAASRRAADLLIDFSILTHAVINDSFCQQCTQRVCIQSRLCLCKEEFILYF